MQVRNLLLTVLLLLICAATFGAQTPLSFSRPTFVAQACAEAPARYEVVYEDEQYLFAIGQPITTGGLYVYGKQQHKWLKLTKLSTEHAQLGHAPRWDVAPVQSPWDYTPLKDSLYVELPLHTVSTIVYPQPIDYDESVQAYRLYFNYQPPYEETLTRFWVLRSDLKQAFN
jgi:hypothetical protein